MRAWAARSEMNCRPRFSFGPDSSVIVVQGFGDAPRGPKPLQAGRVHGTEFCSGPKRNDRISLPNGGRVGDGASAYSWRAGVRMCRRRPVRHRKAVRRRQRTLYSTARTYRVLDRPWRAVRPRPKDSAPLGRRGELFETGMSWGRSGRWQAMRSTARSMGRTGFV